MRRVSLPGGAAVPALGLGTWRLGESRRARAGEAAAVRHAFELGYRLIDTAEMYGDGGAEEVVGAALAAAVAAGELRREDVVIVSKVLPSNAGARAVAAACERSRRRLGIDMIDLYLLHWRGRTPLAETVGAFERLRAAGHIGAWGVSNFDVDDLEELWTVDGGARCAANQIYLSASRRGTEFDLLPWQRERGLPVMAYSPIDQGTLAEHAALAQIGARHGLTAAQVALAWTLRAADVIAIPKSADPQHQRDNLAAAAVQLDATDLAAIDALFPPPRRRQPLAMT